jgi:hypothetical protein
MSSRWLTEPANQVEADLSAALEEARARTPDEVTMRRLWSKVASPDLETPVRSRWPWFVGGVVTSSALAVAVGIWVLPVLPGPHHIITVSVVQERTPAPGPDIEIRPKSDGKSAVPPGEAKAIPAPAAPKPAGPPTVVQTRVGQTR